MTSKQDDMNRNPEGKGGFKEHPENRADGKWDSTMTFKWQYPFFCNMDIKKFQTWLTDNPQHTVIQEIAWLAVAKSRKEHRYLLEVANRTEGMPRQSTDLTSNGQTLSGLIQVNEDNSKEK